MLNGQHSSNILTGNVIENIVMTTAHNNSNSNSNSNSNENEQVQMQIPLNKKETVDSTKNANHVTATSHLQQRKWNGNCMKLNVKRQNLAYRNQLAQQSAKTVPNQLKREFGLQHKLRHLQQQDNSLEEIRIQEVAAYIQLQNAYNILEAIIKENLNRAFTPSSGDDLCFIISFIFIFIYFISFVVCLAI
ncbi:bromodomain-containing protein [Reticulomyxa filosa]|uniref:Bromodomain-containing protein n=1 Tax=Reticulomyxa filosa TaxID=46433 RepID=X6LN99_RETFI|nr:bromodomain-containing protein [Reticulomyxa filosa]|eukprot:ETO02846.1 bromodomain-containing protein [Reticulomyxa filosa]